MLSNKVYGFSPGPQKLIAPVLKEIDLSRSGVDVSKSAAALDDGQSPSAIDVRFDLGGVSPDYGVTAFDSPYAGGADKNIVGLVPFQKESGTRFFLRMRPTGWDRWNGTNWFTLAGALTGGVGNRIRAVSFQDKIIAANGVDKLKSWDGVDGNAIIDLSADAPIARYITRVGNRILAAFIGTDPMGVAWCADGNASDWTNAINGAGATSIEAEGGPESAGMIRGLTTLVTRAIIYRQRQIMMGNLTGQGEQPFRFTTVVTGYGTEAPYSIATSEVGDFFLGHNNIPYLFDGQSEPIPVGEPIALALINSIFDPASCVGVIDQKRREYVLGICKQSGGFLQEAWCFSIRDWALYKKMTWRRKFLADNYRTIGYGGLPTTNDPIVNTVTDIVNTVNVIVNWYASNQADERILFGNDVGQVYYQDTTKPLNNSNLWVSQQFGNGTRALLLDKVQLNYVSTAGATCEVAVSTDGGVTWQAPKVVTLSGTGAPLVATTWHLITGPVIQVRIRVLTGFAVINRIGLMLVDKGPVIVPPEASQPPVENT